MTCQTCFVTTVVHFKCYFLKLVFSLNLYFHNKTSSQTCNFKLVFNAIIIYNQCSVQICTFITSVYSVQTCTFLTSVNSFQTCISFVISVCFKQVFSNLSYYYNQFSIQTCTLITRPHRFKLVFSNLSLIIITSV